MASDCERCVVPSGFVDWNSTDLLPESWQPIPDAPDWVQGSRRGGVLRCTACGRHWYLFHDPKEMSFTDIFELPEVTAILLGPAKLTSALSGLSFQEAVKTQRRKGRKPVRLSARQRLPLERARERAAQVGSPDRTAPAARIERELEEIESRLKRWSVTPG